MNYVSLIQLLDSADFFDKSGRYGDADTIDALVMRTAQYSGPQHMNLDMSQRVSPYRYHEQELADIEENKQHHPRLRVPEQHGEDTGDGAKEFGQDDPDNNEEDREMTELEGHPAPEKKGKYSQPRGRNIFEMDDTDPAKGGSPFHMHGGGALGFTYIDPDLRSPSMRGVQNKYPTDELNNPSDSYKLKMPQTWG